MTTPDCPRCRSLLSVDGLCPGCLLAGAAAAPPDAELTPEYLGELFPKLELLDLLGSNMGTVYKARHRELNRLVALKLLPADGAADVQRFRREASTLAGLRHPNVVPVLDAGRVDGIDYFVMEFVEGETLRQASARLSADPARAVTVVGWVGAVCAALQHAHSCGVIHRDVKPENVVVRADGVPVLIDFGLARTGGGGELTRTAVGMGSGYYTAPEQRADAATADHRADLFSVGVVLYELWTGRPPVGQLPPPGDTASAPDREVRRIATKAMAQNPDDRYQSADDLRHDLETAMSHERTADPSPTRQRSKHLTASQALVVILMAPLALAMIVGGIWGVVVYSARGTPPATSAAKSRAEEVLADLKSDDYKVREAGVKRFAELDSGEQMVLQFAIEDSLKEKLDDPKLFRLATVGPEKEADREKELEPFLKSEKYRTRILECRELLTCFTVYREAEARTQCTNNLKQIGLAMHQYHDTMPTFPTGAGDPQNAGWMHQLLPYVEQGNVYQLPGAGNSGTVKTFLCPSAPSPDATKPTAK